MNMSEAPEFMSATAHAPVRVRLSRTETETLCYKATRGAGYSWGIAEEAANAVGWLCANGIDGTAALAAAIVPPTFNAPDISNDLWVSYDGKPLCPLTTGTALSDFAASVFASNNGHVQLGPVRRPVMLLPFISQCTATTGGSITLEWEGRKLTVGNAIRSDAETLSALISANAATIMLSHCHDVIQADRPNAVAFANPHTLAELDGLALRTTVPASEQSRNSGAGAGTSDND